MVLVIRGQANHCPLDKTQLICIYPVLHFSSFTDLLVFSILGKSKAYKFFSYFSFIICTNSFILLFFTEKTQGQNTVYIFLINFYLLYLKKKVYVQCTYRYNAQGRIYHLQKTVYNACVICTKIWHFMVRTKVPYLLLGRFMRLKL